MITLYSYWRSTAVYRVRLALALKGIAYETRFVDLMAGQQHDEEYRRLNPQGIVPTLVEDGLVVRQSLAILDYLEETRPEPPLLPADKAGRARVRAIAQFIASEMHPLNTMTVQAYLRQGLGLDEPRVRKWYEHWIARGFVAVERALAAEPDTGTFCHGDTPTWADLCLVPQVYNADRFKVDMWVYPTISRVVAACRALPVFAAAEPEKQADFAPA